MQVERYKNKIKTDQSRKRHGFLLDKILSIVGMACSTKLFIAKTVNKRASINTKL